VSGRSYLAQHFSDRRAHKCSGSLNPRPFKQLKDHNEKLRAYCLPVLSLLAMLLRGSPVPVTPEIQLATDHLRSSLGADGDVEAISERILSLLDLVWTHPWTPLINHRISDPTIVCLGLSSLEASGKFSSAKDVTPNISKYEYNMRLVFLILMHRYDTPELGYKAYQQFFKEDVESTFNSLRSAQKVASSIAYLSQALPKIWWVDRKNHQELIYRGTHIHINQLRTLLGALEERMVEVWEQEVLMGLSLHVDYKEIHDDIASTEVPYSFVADPRNKVFSDKLILVRAILSNERLSSKFISFNHNGTLRFNIHSARAWLASLSRFHKLLLLRFHLTGGGLARGTEMVAMLLNNTPTYPLRSLVAFGQYIALLVTYLKTSSLTGIDKVIPHALDAFMSDLLVQELAIARPFAVFMATVCYPGQPQVRTLYEKHVFVNHDRLFDTSDITDGLQQLTLEFMDIELGVSDWRHINTAFRRKLCNRLQELIEEDEEEESIAALQSGHSRKTENRIYGISQETLQGAAEDVLPLFLDATTDWQTVCHIIPGGLRLHYRNALMRFFRSYVQQGLITISEVASAPGEDQTALIRSLCESVTSLRHLVEDQSRALALLSSGYSALQDKMDLLLAGGGPARGLEHGPQKSPTPPEPSTNPDPAPIALSEEDALRALRTLLQKPEATWKTPQQSLAVMAVLDRQHDVIAVLPTNAGKSMVAIIPPLLETDLVTVIILPLRILILDFQRKLKAMGIPFYTYESNTHRIQLGSSNIILVSADLVKWDSWRQASLVLHQHRPIARQIVDEAHIPLLSQDFRHALRNMSDIRTSLPVPLVLLTASAHPDLLKAMRREYGIEENAVVIRGPSNRPELRYQWQSVENMDAMLDVIADAVRTNIRLQEDRAMIFVPWKALGESIAERLGYPLYKGGPDNNNKNAATYQSWLSGHSPIVVATSAFGTGNDYAHVRLVIHACAPYEMVNYVQEVSRAGRDGLPALCLLLTMSGPGFRPPQAQSVPEPDLAGKGVMSKALCQTHRECIRHTITAYNDGRGVECLLDPLNQVCSRCAVLRKLE